MKKKLFKYLPTEIIINIFSRLPVRSIGRSKCVCKPWLDLLRTDDFVNSHLSKSVPALAFSICERATEGVQVFEFEDEIDGVESLDFRSNQLTKFDFPQRVAIVGAANGLLLLKKLSPYVDGVFYICNPITREYVELGNPTKELPSSAYEFGVSRISRQHKVVTVWKSECSVYTLETGSWRRIGVEAAPPSLLHYLDHYRSAFVDGHLYWKSFSKSTLIACFDLEMECFSSFDAPASRGRLSVLKDCLCFVEYEDEIVLWLMKDDGMERSWRKEYVFTKPVFDGYGNRCYLVWPITVFKNGDMLMLCNHIEFILFYNSNKTKAIQEIHGVLTPHDVVSRRGFTLSFLSLKGLGLENVISF